MSNLNNEVINKNKKGLGRGLGSLLGSAVESTSVGTSVVAESIKITENKNTTTSATARTEPQEMTEQNQSSRVWIVAIDKLKSGVYQPRKKFEKTALEELAQSIKENGILQPIVARKGANQALEIIAGERRWRAAQLAGLHEVPVIIKNFENKQALEMAIIENVQREDLNPVEEAQGYHKLSTEFGLSHQQISEKVGKDRVTISNAIRLLSLAAPIREMIINSEISAGHAKVLLSTQDLSQQISLAKEVKEKGLSVRALEKLIQQALSPKREEQEPTPQEQVKLKSVDNLVAEFQKTLGTKVQIDYSNGKGSIKINFYSDEELNKISDVFRKGSEK